MALNSWACLRKYVKFHVCQRHAHAPRRDAPDLEAVGNEEQNVVAADADGVDLGILAVLGVDAAVATHIMDMIEAGPLSWAPSCMSS